MLSYEVPRAYRRSFIYAGKLLQGKHKGWEKNKNIDNSPSASEGGIMEVLSQEPMPMSQLRETIDKIKKRDKEPNFRVKKIEDYLNSFSQLSPAKSKELIEKLKKLNIPRLKEQHIYKIVDILPAKPEDLKALLQPYTITVNNENIKKIVDVVKGFVK